MNTTKIIETVLAATAVAGLAVIFPVTGIAAVELLIAGALVTMTVLETKKRCF